MNGIRTMIRRKLADGSLPHYIWDLERDVPGRVGV
jgi:hypothetical protein